MSSSTGFVRACSEPYTYLYGEVINGVSSELAHAEMAILVRSLEQCDPRPQCSDLFLLFLQLPSLLLDFLVRNTLYTRVSTPTATPKSRAPRHVRS